MRGLWGADGLVASDDSDAALEVNGGVRVVSHRNGASQNA
jgi:hypothetical protein